MKREDATRRPTRTACFVPFYEDNPYQRELAGGIEAQGFELSSRPWLRGMAAEWISGRFRPEVLHLHWLPAISASWKGTMKAIAFVLRLLVLRGLGAKVVWTVHNLYSHESGSRRVERWMTRWVLRLASRVLVHGESAIRLISDEFGDRYAGKLRVVPHGSYLGVYPDDIEPAQARRELGLGGDDVVMLFLGNIRPYKGVSELVDAFMQLDDPKARLVIAGRVKEDRDREYLEGRIGDHRRVMLRPGYIDDDQLQVYMRAADIVVFPYRDVLTSGAVILAMSFGRACLAPRLGCIPDVLDDAGAILYDPDSPGGGLTAAVADVFKRAGELPAMGCHNLAMAESWNWGRIGALTAEAYREALGTSPESHAAVDAANPQPFSNRTNSTNGTP